MIPQGLIIVLGIVSITAIVMIFGIVITEQIKEIINLKNKWKK